MDNSHVYYAEKNAALIKELALYSIDYTKAQKVESFRTDTLHEKEIRTKFSKHGYEGRVIVNFSDKKNDLSWGSIDSTVIFEQITFRGIIEIIYDFSVNARDYRDDPPRPDYAFRKATERIYYRRRPFPFM